ncbi:hypothetical protein [Streptomyces spiralis]
MRPVVASRTVALVVLALLWVQACSAQPAKNRPSSRPSTPSAPYLGNRAYAVPDSPFTRKDTVVTATCDMGARYASVAVRAWDPGTWRQRAERYFAIPSDAAFANVEGYKPVSSPLVELCGVGHHSPSPYGVATAEHMTPRVRALFDLGFTRMAVVLRDSRNKKVSHVGYVVTGADQEEVVRLGGGADDDEQNAVMAPDGRSVWFTYTASDGKQRIGSRSADGDHHLTDEGPAAGHGLPLTVTGKPARAVQANMVHLAPNGRRLTATAPGVFGTVFDTWNSSGPLTRTSAHGAVLLSGCLGVVGWVGEDRVLCRTSSGVFRTTDARTGRAVGAPVHAVGPQEGMVAEGMLVSADGKKFIVSVHPPNAQHNDEDYAYEAADFRTVWITPGGASAPISDPFLDGQTVFLSWS